MSEPDTASAVFETHDPTGRGWALCLRAPRRTLVATRIDQVLDVIDQAEKAAFDGNWVALTIAYEAAPAFDSALETHPRSNFPLVWAGIFDLPHEPVDGSPTPYQISAWTPGIERADYSAAIASIRGLIEAGDTYQVNYSFPLIAAFAGDIRTWFDDLCAAQGAGYCALINTGVHHILSISPELFVERTGDALRTRPMKGTFPRGRWQSEDEGRALELAANDKMRAENLMIVDLLRNDLGKVSQPGSVVVDSLFAAERYETLWQLTSEISSKCNPATSLRAVLTALFPCGSITGAPKVRTMQIIRELEPFARGLYTGAIGFIKPGGDFVFNVAIRTIVVDAQTNRATFGVGGGITSDSTDEGEYEECLLKAEFLARPRREFDLLETMLLSDGTFPLEPYHLDRVLSSAAYFGFAISLNDIEATLSEMRTNHSQGRWKVRILFGKDGVIRAIAEKLDSEATNHEFKVGLAAGPVSSKDRFLYHKTTYRETYDRARRSRPDLDDVILWNERGEVTESTIANIVIDDGNGRWTPARSCGLLAGTMRASLLATDAIRERVILKEELVTAKEIFLINSVRGWMPARLVDSV